MVARQQGYYGTHFRSERGTTQGDIISPMIFNIVVDAVVREWYHKTETQGPSTTVHALFYADDGLLYSTDADVNLFHRMVKGRKENTYVDNFQFLDKKKYCD
jgi:hypothetical protein